MWAVGKSAGVTPEVNTKVHICQRSASALSNIDLFLLSEYKGYGRTHSGFEAQRRRHQKSKNIPTVNLPKKQNKNRLFSVERRKEI